jgi:hypothetical protein
MAHFGVGGNSVTWPGACSSTPDTGDDHVVKIQISCPCKAEIVVKC